jgi:molybdopterin converting factor small subunit
VIELVVHLFGPAREAAGAARAPVRVEPPATAGAVVAALGALHPALAPLLERSRVAVNHAYVDPDAAIGPDDEIALIPPVGGG